VIPWLNLEDFLTSQYQVYGIGRSASIGDASCAGSPILVATGISTSASQCVFVAFTKGCLFLIKTRGLAGVDALANIIERTRPDRHSDLIFVQV
jgi:hypothetical protein